MSITTSILSFGVKYLFNESADQIIGFIENRLTDHSEALPKALRKANDRAWEAVGLALAGESLFGWVKDVFRDADMKGVRDQIKGFLDSTPTGLENAPAGFRAKATEEWNRLRKANRFSASTVSAAEMARRAVSMERHGDPARMTAAAHQAVKDTADLLQDDAPHLAELLTAAPAGGTPLLAAAFAFFFRRELETNSELAHGLSFDFLKLLSERQDRGLEILDIRTAGILDQIDVLFDSLEKWFTINHAKLDEINDKLDELITKRDVATRTTDPLKVSVTNEKELALLRRWLGELRELPPELIDAALWSKLGDALAAGRILAEARAAQEAAAAAAKATADRGAEAEAAYKMYRVACEQEEWADAMTGLVRAATLDPARFAPFPLNRYEPVRILGAGGFGTVVLCRERFKKNREVAVKALHIRDDFERTLDELFGEAHTVSELAHPALIRVYHWEFADPDEKRPYLVMEYFDGVSLTAHLKAHGPLPVTAFIHVARCVATAMEAAHRRGVLHRDLKPGNILVRPGSSGWDGRKDWGDMGVRVIDFGLAVRFSAVQASVSTSLPHRTRREQSFAGTQEYASPEQKRLIDFPVGPRSDVYSFGKSMLEALLGSPEPVTADWEVVPEEIRDPLRRLLEKCIIRDPARRHPDFHSINDDFEELAEQAYWKQQRQQTKEQPQQYLVLDLHGEKQRLEEEAGEQRTDADAESVQEKVERMNRFLDRLPPRAEDAQRPAKEEAEHKDPLQPGEVRLVVNDYYNITRNLNPWLTEDVCRSSVVTVECVGMAGNPSFRFVPFNKGPAYGMKLAGDADRAAWGRITAAANDTNRVSLRIRYSIAPVTLAEETPVPANQDATPDQLLKDFRGKHPELSELIDLVVPGNGDPTVENLLSAIRHANWHVRRSSAVLFGKLGAAGMVGGTALVEALADPEADVRRAAQESLTTINPQWASCDPAFQAIPTLRSQLTHTQNDVRQAAATVLGTLGTGAKVAISDLVVCLVDNHEPVRQVARLALDQITPNWPSSIQAHQAVPRLIETLRATNEAVRGAAVTTLGIIRPGADEHLRALAAHLWTGPVELRLAGMAVLAKIGTASRAVSPSIAANLVDPEVSVRKAAEDTLNIVDPNWPQHPQLNEMLPRLLELLHHGDGGVRAKAAAFTGNYLPVPDAAPPLAAAELDQDQSVRKAAAEAFAKLPKKTVRNCYTSRSVESLTKALGQPDSGLRLHALTKLEWFGNEAVDSIGSIIPLIADQDQSVRQAAEKCLDAVDRDWKLNRGMQQAALDLIEILKDLPDNTAPQQSRRDSIVKVLRGLGNHGGFLVERLTPLLKSPVPARKVTTDRKYLCGLHGESSDHDYTYAFGIERAAAEILAGFGPVSAVAIPNLIENVQRAAGCCEETARQSCATLDIIDPMWPENHLDDNIIRLFSGRILDERGGALYWKICTRLTSKGHIAAEVWAKTGIDSGRPECIWRCAQFLGELGASAVCAIPALKFIYKKYRNAYGSSRQASTDAEKAIQQIQEAAKQSGISSGSFWSRIFGS